MNQFIFLLVFIILLFPFVLSVELTFELPASGKQCFYEDIKSGIKSTIEYQVVTGGKYDVDLTVQDTKGTVLYSGQKKQYDTFTWTSVANGVYSFCFSNEFSTNSYKLVYFDLQVGEDSGIPGIAEHQTAMTKVEQSVTNIHTTLKELMNVQNHHKLNEASGRIRAEDLNSKVTTYSLLETMTVIIISIGQVFILRNFFTDKKTIRT